MLGLLSNHVGAISGRVHDEVELRVEASQPLDKQRRLLAYPTIPRPRHGGDGDGVLANCQRCRVFRRRSIRFRNVRYQMRGGGGTVTAANPAVEGLSSCGGNLMQVERYGCMEVWTYARRVAV